MRDSFRWPAIQGVNVSESEVVMRRVMQIGKNVLAGMAVVIAAFMMVGPGWFYRIPVMMVTSPQEVFRTNVLVNAGAIDQTGTLKLAVVASFVLIAVWTMDWGLKTLIGRLSPLIRKIVSVVSLVVLLIPASFLFLCFWETARYVSIEGVHAGYVFTFRWMFATAALLLLTGCNLLAGILGVGRPIRRYLLVCAVSAVILTAGTVATFAVGRHHVKMHPAPRLTYPIPDYEYFPKTIPATRCYGLWTLLFGLPTAKR